MHRHRFLGREELGPASPPSGFTACPLSPPPGWVGEPFGWQQLYRLAYERAQALLRPSRWERWGKPAWN